MQNEYAVTCSACEKVINVERDVFQISSPFVEKNVHSCQQCWNLILIKSFQKEAMKKGIKLTIK